MPAQIRRCKFAWPPQWQPLAALRESGRSFWLKPELAALLVEKHGLYPQSAQAKHRAERRKGRE